VPHHDAPLKIQRPDTLDDDVAVGLDPIGAAPVRIAMPWEIDGDGLSPTPKYSKLLEPYLMASTRSMDKDDRR
jgi:hypothetical protein